MKVVHVTLRFDAPGGVETNVRELARRQRERGDDVHVFASDLYDEARWERRSDFRPTVDGVPVQRFPVRRRLVPWLNLPMFVGLIDALASSGADVIHAHSHRYGHVLQAAAVARRLGIPLVVSTSYHPPDRRETRRTRAILRLVDVGFGMTAYRTARVVAVQSELEAGLVREFAPADRIRIVPPGIDLAAWAEPVDDRRARFDLPERYVLFAGRIASNKGLPVLFDAVGSIPATDRPPLVLMGADWGERAALESRARTLGISESVRWLGHVDDPRDYRAVFRGASCLVLPSEWEAYGFVLLEAMAAGVPIVASAVGAVPEVLDGGRRGRLVPYGAPDRLATAIRDALADTEESARLERTAAEYVRGLDWSESAERFRRIYAEVAAGGRPRSSRTSSSPT